jgi:hypothetical protein
MKRLSFAKVANLAQLRDELAASLPAGAELSGVEGTADRVVVTVADGADAAAVATLVGSHVPTVPVVVPGLTAAQRDLLRAYLAGTEPSTLAELRGVLRALTVFLRRRLGDV